MAKEDKVEDKQIQPSKSQGSTISSRLVFREYFESLSVAIIVALIIRFFILMISFHFLHTLLHIQKSDKVR